MPIKRLTQAEKESIACIYEAKKASQSDLAIQFGISRATVRRALHEFGLVTNNCEATAHERNMLDTIQSFSIENVERLRQVLQRGLQC